MRTGGDEEKHESGGKSELEVRWGLPTPPTTAQKSRSHPTGSPSTTRAFISHVRGYRDRLLGVRPIRAVGYGAQAFTLPCVHVV